MGGLRAGRWTLFATVAAGPEQALIRCNSAVDLPVTRIMRWAAEEGLELVGGAGIRR